MTLTGGVAAIFWGEGRSAFAKQKNPSEVERMKSFAAGSKAIFRILSCHGLEEYSEVIRGGATLVKAKGMRSGGRRHVPVMASSKNRATSRPMCRWYL